jgi:ElaA protein
MTYLDLAFNQLSLQQLYDVLQLRSEVFVVEQDCVYQDIDAYDQVAQHILFYQDSILIGYARVLPSGTYFKEPSIGRVIIKASHRKLNLGHDLMDYAIEYITNNYPNKTIKISAQQHLNNFYTVHGFVAKGEGYLEDGIPHIAMYR